MAKTCFAEFSFNLPVRIFRTTREAIAASIEGRDVREIPLAEATGSIRRIVFERDGYECRDCALPVSWAGENGVRAGELHEVTPRSRHGEISVENGICLCHECHTGSKTSRHGARHPQWSKSRGLPAT